jgi:uncharacterized cupredoxin-like copper-binding protein
MRIVGAVAVLLVAAAISGPALALTSHSTTTVTVTATEFHFKFSPATVHSGKVTFHLVNKGHVTHDLKIDKRTSAKIAPGKSTNLTVTLKAGKYPYLCTIPGHAAAGMKGTLVVK